MSKCISNWGEFSEHEYTGDNATCDYCGQVSEMIAVDQLQTMRAALEAIQKVHPKEYASSGDEAYELNPRCGNCGTAFPCSTRRLADQGLGDNLARTTKNGEKP